MTLAPAQWEGQQMYEIAATVGGWLDEGRPVTLARLIDTRGFSSTDPATAVAFTPHRPLAGTLLAGAADGQLAAALDGVTGPTVVEVRVSEAEALGAGLSCGGHARLLAQPASDLSRGQWERLESAVPTCVVTDIDGDTTRTTVFSPEGIAALDSVWAQEIRRLFARGTSRTSAFEAGQALTVATALWPVARLAVVGDGLIADALAALGQLLDWPVEQITDPSDGAAVAQSLRPGDGLVVLSHDLAIAGPALLSALRSGASAHGTGPGYIGALGSRRTQATRAAWLSERGVGPEQLRLVHGPAGLDIGAQTPVEIAIAIVAEMLGVRSRAVAGSLADAPVGSLRDRSGPVHPAGVQAPPPRYPPT